MLCDATLEQAVGSYALLEGSGFEYTDGMQALCPSHSRAQRSTRAPWCSASACSAAGQPLSGPLVGAQVAKFAEGESSVLMQKLARDRVKQAARAVPAPRAVLDLGAHPCRDDVRYVAWQGAAGASGAEEEAIAAELRGAKGCAASPPPATALYTIGRPPSARRYAEWLAAAPKVYLLAELLMDRTMERMLGAPLPKGIARPFARL
jgi:hypothetical protein